MTGRRTETITLEESSTPARNLPAALWMDMRTVLRFHGLDPNLVDLFVALKRLIDQTPVEKGGRLRPDGTIDRDDVEDDDPS